VTLDIYMRLSILSVTDGRSPKEISHISLASILGHNTAVIYVQYFANLLGTIRRNVCEDCCTFGHFIAELPVKIMDCTFTPDLYSPKSVRTEYTQSRAAINHASELVPSPGALTLVWVLRSRGLRGFSVPEGTRTEKGLKGRAT